MSQKSLAILIIIKLFMGLYLFWTKIVQKNAIASNVANKTDQ